MSDDAHALNEQLKATAAAFNANATDASLTDEENAARIAAAELNKVQGSVDHNGTPEVQADTPESIAAREAKAAEAAAAEAAKETPEQAAVREAEEALAAARKAAGIEEPAAEPETPAVDEWIATDSKEFNAAMSLMKAAGMTPAEAADLFNPATTTGDLSKVDQAVLVEKVGEDKAALIMAGLTTYVETEGQAALAVTKAAHDAVGGSENWAKMVSWARGKAAGDEAFTAQVEGITAMLNSGNAFQADMAATKFKELYNADPKNSTVGTPAATLDVTKAAAAPAAPTATPLTAREYAEQVGEADRLRGPGRAAKLEALRIGRALGRSQGL